MQQTVNRKYGEIFTTKRYYTILMGGRGAGRSTVASQLMLAKLIAPDYFRCAIMRYILSDIRNSCFQEILDRAEEQGIRDKLEVNESLMTIGYKKNFIHAHAFRKSSGEQKAKLKSLANYNQIWVEEADEPPENDFIQLDDSLRTVKGDINVLMTLNSPPKSHWIIRRWFTLLPSEQSNYFIPTCNDENVLFIHTDWHDNAVNIARDTQLRYEDYKRTKPAHYWSMIKGYVPETVIGRVFDGWQEIESVPFEAKKERTGLDFGWDPDPAAIVDVYYYNGGYIFDEVLYATRQRNADLGNTLMTMPDKKLVIADQAEPKSIAEIKLMGVNIIACEKGADSIVYGVGVIQSEKISFTSRSIHLKDEYENYAIKKDKDGNLIPGEYTEGNDHCFSPSTLIYTTNGKKRIDELVGKSGYLYSRGGTIQKFSNVRVTRRNAEMLSLTMDDGQTLTVTPDHLLLKPDGEWIEARLLSPLDMIQSVIHEANTDIQRKKIYPSQWRKIFQQWTKKNASFCLGILQWRYPEGLSYSSQGPQYTQQCDRELGIERQDSSPKRTYDTRTTGQTEALGRKDKTTYQEVAQIKRGEGVAQVTWDRNIQEERGYFKKLCSLSQRLYDFAICRKCTFLPPELQNESSTKKIVGISRGFEAVTYNLEVENTNCLWADGVIAHNCLDAARYAMSSLIPMIKKRDMIRAQAQNPPRLRTNVAV